MELDIPVTWILWEKTKHFWMPKNESFHIGCGPLTVTVTTKIITFLIGNPYKPYHCYCEGATSNFHTSSLMGNLQIEKKNNTLPLTGTPHLKPWLEDGFSFSFRGKRPYFRANWSVLEPYFRANWSVLESVIGVLEAPKFTGDVGKCCGFL